LQKVADASNFPLHAVGPQAPGSAARNASATQSNDDHNPQRSKRAVIARKLASLSAAFLAATILSSIFASDAGRMRMLSSAVPEIGSVIAFAGFGLDQVTLKGQRYALVADIFEALDLENTRTFADFDAAAARTRIEAISWVATAELRRVYPSQLVVDITERKPFALWQEADGRTSLVDRDGRVLSSMGRHDAPQGLVRIKGAGAPEAASGLWEDLARYPKFEALLEEAARISRRRWSLNLKNGAVIELPSGAVSAALQRLHDWPGFEGISQRGNTIADMRTAGRIAIRPTEPVEPIAQQHIGPRNISDLLEPAG